MSLKFLSDEWFAKVEELMAAAGDLDIPEQLIDLTLNVTVIDPDIGELALCLNAGNMQKGHHDNASTKLELPFELARRLFVENDQSAGIEGFMNGQIKVEGDMSKLMVMQSVQPSDAQRLLQKQILEITI